MLTQVGVHEQGPIKMSALMLASRHGVNSGMKGIVEKLLAAGAKAETTDEVKWRERDMHTGMVFACLAANTLPTIAPDVHTRRLATRACCWPSRSTKETPTTCRPDRW